MKHNYTCEVFNMIQYALATKEEFEAYKKKQEEEAKKMMPGLAL